MANEIDKIIKNSSRQEIIDFLSDPKNEFDTLLVCWHTSDRNFGFSILKFSDGMTSLGLLDVIKGNIGNQMLDSMDDAEDESDAEL